MRPMRPVKQTDMAAIVVELPDAAATRSLGIRLGQMLPAGTVLLLQGDLGAGKTSLVQGIGAGLGIQESIDSPTFTLINEYLDGRVPLYHLDLYRLEPAATAALSVASYWEGVEVEPGIVAIEWAERLPYLPEHYVRLQWHNTATDGRKIALEIIGADGFERMLDIVNLINSSDELPG
jgi:tRNA threonylcarbamoyladenosine biosynthesis protein TsaE